MFCKTLRAAQLTRRFTRGYAVQASDRAVWAKQHLSPGVGRMTDMEIVSGKGSWVTDSHGQKYLDFTCGIAVTNTGHCHPRVVKAAQDQVANIIHSQVTISYHKPMLDLVERLQTITPSGLDCFFFSNSGAEAVEASVKLARHATKKQNVIVFQGSFHGRTVGAMSLTTSKYIYRAGFGPLMPGVVVSPFPYCYHCPYPKTQSNSCCNDPIKQLELIFKQQTSPADTAAILIEPILGEGGYVVPPNHFLPELRKICTKNDVLLIVDEVQTGFGRTGKYFAVEHWNVTPDILVFAKGIASGFPLSGIVSTSAIMSKQPPGSMGGTYSANAVSCAAANATFDVIKEENLIQNTKVRGEELMSALKNLKQKYPVITDVRGLGLMIAVEFDTSKSGIANLVSKECANNGMLILTTSCFEVLRFIPPLNVSASEINQGVKIFENSLATAIKSFK